MAQNSFWSDKNLEPKRKYRFKLLMDGQPDYVVTKVKNPAVKISETPHKFLNHTFYYPGRAEWDPIDISFVDPGGGDDQSDALQKRMRQAGYASPKDSSASKRGFTKARAVGAGAVGKVKIQQLGVDFGENILIPKAEWELFNAFFTNIAWGDYDYNGEELLECSVTIRYDYAEFNLL